MTSSPLEHHSDPHQTITIKGKAPPLWALLIGIDKYAHPEVKNLKGAVADTEAVQSFLEHDLFVPLEQIRRLHNEEATRDGIIQAWFSLLNDQGIHENDPILVYYSGHGGSSDAPEGWSVERSAEKIQCLIPHDYGVKQPDGEPQQPITDRAIGHLIDMLAAKKGDNITIIFDCCHSSSGTRAGPPDPTLLVRGIEMDPLPPYFDDGINFRMSIVAPQSQYKALRSHVLLAACGAKEKAIEKQGRGRFTQSLLKTFRSLGVERATYYEVMKRIPLSELPGQNPQCEGRNQNRIVFNGMAPSRGRKMYPVRQRSRGRGFLMQAGAAQGVTRHSQYDIYRDARSAEEQSAPLGRLIATSVSQLMTELVVAQDSSKFELQERAWAMQSHAGDEEDLRVHIADDRRLVTLFDELYERMNSTTAITQQILLVDKDTAELDIALDDSGQVVFTITNDLCIQYGLTVMPYTVPLTAGDVHPVLQSAAHFYWHLRRSNASVKEQPLRDMVEVEIVRLQESRDAWVEGSPFMYIPEDGAENLNVANVVDMVVDDAVYGVNIRNKGHVDLYCSVYYFDISDLSIMPYYEPATGPGEVDAPLPPGGSLAIGYGTGGSSPHKFFLRDNQDIDVGFVKIFITTHPVSLSDIEQMSPFPDAEDGGTPRAPPPVKSLASWDTVIVTLVQRRYPLQDSAV